MARSHHDDDYEEMLDEYYLDVGRTKAANADTYRLEIAGKPASEALAGNTVEAVVRV